MMETITHFKNLIFQREFFWLTSLFLFCIQVKIVILDSIAFHFRHDFEDMALRTRLLHGLVQSFMKMACEHRLAVSSMGLCVVEIFIFMSAFIYFFPQTLLSLTLKMIMIFFCLKKVLLYPNKAYTLIWGFDFLWFVNDLLFPIS